jgi:hypothetical protein
MIIRVSRAVPGLEIERDGVSLAPAAWDAALPVDPGDHTVRAKALGFEPWTASVPVSQPGQAVTVDVPELRALPVAGASTSSGKPTPDTSGPSSTAPSGRKLPWGLMGSGAAIALGGGVLMLIESNRASNARDNHDPSAYDASKTPWDVGLAGVIVGMASAGLGATLLALERGDAGRATPAVAVWIDGGGRGGVLLAKSW